MAEARLLIPELDNIIKHGDPKRRTDAAQRISDLFLQDAAQFQPAHVDLFDGVLTGLVPHTELSTRVDLAERLSTLGNAPRTLVGQLAREDEIRVAGPLLRCSPVLDDATLIEIAANKDQGHLLAMTERPVLSPGITDVIVRRGDREVVRNVAGNGGAQFSHNGYSAMIQRAGDDGALALAVGQRDDLSAPQLKDLLGRSVDIIRRRLIEAAKPSRKNAINQAIVEISGALTPATIRRDFAAAQRIVVSLHHAQELDESALINFAKAHKYEESVAALSAMSAVRIAIIDSLIAGDRKDPVLILGKALGLDWATVRALITLQLGPKRSLSDADLEIARANFGRLVPSTAQRVLNFWQMRRSA